MGDFETQNIDRYINYINENVLPCLKLTCFPVVSIAIPIFSRNVVAILSLMKIETFFVKPMEAMTMLIPL